MSLAVVGLFHLSLLLVNLPLQAWMEEIQPRSHLPLI